MCTSKDLQVWKDRWQSLDESLGQLLVRLGEVTAATELPRKETICSVLQGLRLFGDSHFDYFYQGFLNGKLVEDTERYPPATVLRSITDQIAYDLEVIQRAIDQRLAAGVNSEFMRKGLATADILGQMALQPAIDCHLISPGTTVLTYFQKSTSVRVIPYANVAIIGLPFTALEVSRDYLAIPHEVAHYIYRHGNCDGQAISLVLREDEGVRTQPQYLKNWLEEMFADAYGCLIAGPVMALDFQDLQLDDPIDEFTRAYKDYEDPVPVLRPDIYTKVLAYRREEGDPWGRIALLLQERWNAYRDSYLKRAEEAPLNFVTRNRTVLLDDIRQTGPGLDDNKALDQALQAICEMIAGIGGGGAWSGDQASLDRIQAMTALAQLYDNFDSFLQTIKKKPDQVEATPPTASLWGDWVARWACRHGYEYQEGNLATAGRNPKTKGKTWGWIDLAYADGWATRGPEPNPPPPH